MANVIFNNKSIRVINNNGNPLVVAKDVCQALGIKNHRDAVSNITTGKKHCVGCIDAQNRMRQTIALDEPGLLELVCKSRVPEAIAFKEWLFEKVLPSIRKTGSYDIRNDLEGPQPTFPVMPPVVDHIQPVQTNVLSPVKPLRARQRYDLNRYRGSSCIYLIHIADNDYKYGRSNSADTRIITHISAFTECGYSSALVKIWKCETAEIMINVEGMITKYAKWNDLLVDFAKYKQREIITTDDIDGFVSIIDEYVEGENSRCERTTDAEKLLRLEIAKIQAEIESKRIELERERIALESYKLKMHLAPPRCIPQYIQPTYSAPLTIVYPSTVPKPNVMIEQPPLNILDDDSDSESSEEPPVVDAPVAQIQQPVPMLAPIVQPPAPVVNEAPPNPRPPAKKREKVPCICGKMVMPTNKAHIRSQKHIRAMAQRNQ